MKYKVKIKDMQLNLKATAGFFKKIDMEEMSKFEKAFLRGFFKPFIIKKNYVEMIAPVGITLAERIKKPINKRDFLMIIEQVSLSVNKVLTSNLKLDNVVFDINHVYINETTKELQFIYIAAEDKESTDIFKFLEELSLKVKTENPQEGNFPIKFVNWMYCVNPFNPLKIEEYVMKEDPSVVNSIKKQTAQSGFMTNKPQSYFEHYSEKKVQDNIQVNSEINNESEVNKQSFRQSYGQSVASNNFANKINLPGNNYLDNGNSQSNTYNDEISEETSLLVDMDDNETALLVEDNTNYPTLIRIKTSEEITINKPVFRLGKERAYSDYCIIDNGAVSRNHAEIVNRAGTYFVLDLNSKNHTYINGSQVNPGNEIEIHNGDRLTLANEEFTFNF